MFLSRVRMPNQRLGISLQQTRSQRCGFCGEPVGATDHPGNQTNCPKKAGFGEYIDAKKNKDVARVKLARIIEGREVNFRRNLSVIR